MILLGIQGSQSHSRPIKGLKVRENGSSKSIKSQDILLTYLSIDCLRDLVSTNKEKLRVLAKAFALNDHREYLRIDLKLLVDFHITLIEVWVLERNQQIDSLDDWYLKAGVLLKYFC